MQTATGARIKMPGVQQESDEIVITGEPSAVQAAIRTLQAFVLERTKVLTVPVTVESNIKYFVCGPNNQTLKELQEATGTKISTEDNSDVIKVHGDRDNVAKAVESLQQIIAEKVL